jgi:hypothetical protein
MAITALSGSSSPATPHSTFSAAIPARSSMASCSQCVVCPRCATPPRRTATSGAIIQGEGSGAYHVAANEPVELATNFLPEPAGMHVPNI